MENKINETINGSVGQIILINSNLININHVDFSKVSVGLTLLYCNGVLVNDSRFIDIGFIGIEVIKSWNITIANNFIDNARKKGVLTVRSRDIQISNNTLLNTFHGIEFDEFSWYSNVTYNTMESSFVFLNITTISEISGLPEEGTGPNMMIFRLSGFFFKNNTINGRPFIIRNGGDCDFSELIGQLYLVGCNSMVIESVNFALTLYYSNNITVLNATFEHTYLDIFASHGIDIVNSNFINNSIFVVMNSIYLNITKNNFYNSEGINIIFSFNITLTNNVIKNSKSNAVNILYTHDILIENNLISNNPGSGINFNGNWWQYDQEKYSYSIFITNNKLANNSLGIYFSDDLNSDLLRIPLKIQNNDIYGNEIGIWIENYYYNGKQRYSGVIENNNITENSYIGIYMQSENNLIYLNLISKNDIGIFLGTGVCWWWCYGASYNIIINNQISDNFKFGIEISNQTSQNTILQNIFMKNGKKSENKLYNHVFEGDQPNLVLNNFWSEWTKPDSNGDGIVDIPYVVGGYAKTCDPFPTTNPSSFLIEPPQAPLFACYPQIMNLINMNHTTNDLVDDYYSASSNFGPDIDQKLIVIGVITLMIAYTTIRYMNSRKNNKIISE